MSEITSTEKAKRLRRIVLGSAAAVIAIALFVTLVIIKPAMPDRIRLLTGPEGSSYLEVGRRFADELRRRGLEVDLVETQGGLDNIHRLAADGEDAVAFAPSVFDLTDETDVDTEHLVSFGSIDFAPLWLFYRTDRGIERISDLAGLELATEGRGTASDSVARSLIEKHGLAGEVEIRSLADPGIDSVAEALRNGIVDAAFIAGSPRSSAIQSLLHADNVSLLSFERAAAYAARIPGLITLVAPEGVFDLSRNVPSEDVQLISGTTNLVAVDSIHPAVAPIVLTVAADLRENARAFSSTVSFPNGQHLAFRLEPSARRYFQQGETWLSRHLPYRVERHLKHLGLVVIPVLTVVVVLLKMVPAALRNYGKLRLNGLFRQLARIEKAHAAGGDRSKLLDDLDRVDHASAKIFMPRSVVHDYVDFRQFLHDMRERVREGEDRA